jgi:hypothetical protein
MILDYQCDRTLQRIYVHWLHSGSIDWRRRAAGVLPEHRQSTRNLPEEGEQMLSGATDNWRRGFPDKQQFVGPGHDKLL